MISCEVRVVMSVDVFKIRMVLRVVMIFEIFVFDLSGCFS